MTVEEAAGESRRWLFDDLLPFWAEAGRDMHGGYVEQIDRAGDPVHLPKRCRVQSRQLYVFAEAGRMGWQGPWRACVDHAATFLLEAYRRPDSLYRASVDRTGAPHDDTADNYDQAFTLFALAQLYRLTGDETLRVTGKKLIEALRTQRGHPHGGFHEATPPIAPLRANPHMHLFEATLAWLEFGHDADFHRLASELADLCIARFIDARTGALTELFDLDWSSPRDADPLVEPGHQFEWAWLLLRWRALGGQVDLAVPDRMYRFAARYGVNAARSVAINAIQLDGSVSDPTARLWPQTERLKAALAFAEIGIETERRTADAVDAWIGLSSYRATAHPALFHDKLRDDGSFHDEHAFASSLYHITCALSELDSFASRRNGN